MQPYRFMPCSIECEHACYFAPVTKGRQTETPVRNESDVAKHMESGVGHIVLSSFSVTHTSTSPIPNPSFRPYLKINVPTRSDSVREESHTPAPRHNGLALRHHILQSLILFPSNRYSGDHGYRASRCSRYGRDLNKSHTILTISGDAGASNND